VVRGGAFHAVHLYGRDIVVPDKAQVVPVKASGFRNGRVWMCVRFSAGLAFYSFREVDHADIQFAASDKPTHGGFTHGKGLPVGVHNVIDGLAFADKGADKGIDGLELAGGKVKAIA